MAAAAAPAAAFSVGSGGWGAPELTSGAGLRCMVAAVRQTKMMKPICGRGGWRGAGRLGGSHMPSVRLTLQLSNTRW